MPKHIIELMKELPEPRDFSRPTSTYNIKNDVRASSVAYNKQMSQHNLAEKIWTLLPVMESRLGSSLTQTLANAYTVRRATPIDEQTDLRPIFTLVSPFLTKEGKTNWANSWQAAAHAWLCDNSPLNVPHDPIIHRHKGPAKDTARLHTTHTVASPFLVFHFAWDYLTPNDRARLLQTHPVMTQYARLRRSASSRILASLRQPRPNTSDIPPLCHRRAWLMGCALVRFNFVYADFIRWLGGEYTNDHRDWTSIFQLADHIAKVPIPTDSPPIDLDRTLHIATSGAPIAGHFECEFQDTLLREKYDNHPPVREAGDKVREKFEKEESLSYQIALPRFTWAFIDGLFISPISFVIRNPGEEGRICPDPSNKIAATEDGAANARIPDTGAPGKEDENPKVYYGTAFMRMLIWIWNLRIAQPYRDILGHVDDISAAYHRILYHPAMGIVFAQVFQEFLMIPSGLIFGSKSSPSWYMLPAELRAHIAAAGDFSDLSTELSDRIVLPAPLTAREEIRLTKAAPDTIHKGDLHRQLPYRHISFVDDTVKAAWPDEIRNAIKNSVLSAYVMFGFPAENRRPSPLNQAEWEETATASFKYLGFMINTRAMTVTWPVEKRVQLAKMLDDTWLNDKSVPTASPQEASKLLGLIRHGALVCPLGIQLSLRLQFELNDHVRKTSQSTKRRWWTTCRFRIPLRYEQN